MAGLREDEGRMAERAANRTVEPTADPTSPPAVVLEHVSFSFDDHEVLRDVSLTVPKGSMTMILGASGAGKSVLLKLILGLYRPDSGAIVVNGHRIDTMAERDLLTCARTSACCFRSALFDSLTVAITCGYRLYEETDMPMDQIAHAHPRRCSASAFATSSIGCRRHCPAGSGHVAIARAMASKPNLLLFDDPTTGLDPITATTVDDEIVKLRDLEHVTSAYYAPDPRCTLRRDSRSDAQRQWPEDCGIDPSTGDRARFIVFHEGRIAFAGNVAEPSVAGRLPP